MRRKPIEEDEEQPLKSSNDDEEQTIPKSPDAADWQTNFCHGCPNLYDCYTPPKKEVVSEDEVSNITKLVVLVAVCGQYVSAVTFIQFSRSKLSHSNIQYATSTAVVMSEVFKTLIGFIYVSINGDLSQVKNSLWKISVPAFCYLAQNNFQFIALSNLDSCSFQILYQIKTFTTALFSIFLLGKTIDSREWMAIFLLVSGIMLANYTSVKPSAENDQLVNRNTTLGVAVVLISCFTSGFAGVWLEKILKGVKVDLWVRNIQLGVFSTLGGLIIVWQKDFDFVQEHGFFGGYTWSTWLVIAINTVGGYLIAMCMKYSSNITKAFANGMAIIITTCFSVILFGVNVNEYFMIAVFLVVFSVYVNTDRTLEYIRRVFVALLLVLGLSVLWLHGHELLLLLGVDQNSRSPIFFKQD